MHATNPVSWRAAERALGAPASTPAARADIAQTARARRYAQEAREGACSRASRDAEDDSDRSCATAATTRAARPLRGSQVTSPRDGAAERGAPLSADVSSRYTRDAETRRNSCAASGFALSRLPSNVQRARHAASLAAAAALRAALQAALWLGQSAS